jgi:hypothetical protein
MRFVLRGAHSKNFWGGVPNFLGPTFMAQYPNNNNNLYLNCIIVSADNTMIALIAGINTGAEILHSFYLPGARSISFSKNCQFTV